MRVLDAHALEILLGSSVLVAVAAVLGLQQRFTAQGNGAVFASGAVAGFMNTTAGIAGPAFLVGLALAAVAATCNALSSAELAAEYPQSGGTYEYGYRVLSPWAGFAAGWMFVVSKIAAAYAASTERISAALRPWRSA